MCTTYRSVCTYTTVCSILQYTGGIDEAERDLGPVYTRPPGLPLPPPCFVRTVCYRVSDSALCYVRSYRNTSFISVHRILRSTSLPPPPPHSIHDYLTAPENELMSHTKSTIKERKLNKRNRSDPNWKWFFYLKVLKHIIFTLIGVYKPITIVWTNAYTWLSCAQQVVENI